MERWLRARLIPVPCLRLLALNFPVQDYFRAVRVGEEAVLGRRAEVYLAITRRDYTVHHYTLSRSEYQLLHALIAGQSMGQAIQQAAQGDGDDFAQHAARLHDWFQAWTANGFFRAVEIAD